MRYLAIPLMALALNFASADPASAGDRHRVQNGRGHQSHGNGNGYGHDKPRTEVPELDGSTLPAALTLLAGASMIVVSRRRKAGQAG
jgi:hypothetical protein